MSKKNKIKDLKEENLRLSYELEAADNEIEYLNEELAVKNNKLWEVITENDRLTLTYEPYRPEGDENADKDFYGLIEENNELQNEIEHLHSRIRTLSEQKADFQSRLLDLQYQHRNCKRYKKNGSLSFDFWPWRDWFRLSYHKWEPGKAAQLCIGPVRIDWFAD